MSKPWMGYIGSVLIFVAGVLVLSDGRYITASILFLVAIAGIILKLRMSRKNR